MGTRFIATKECVHAHEIYKKQLVEGTENDTVIIKKSLGAPARVILNSWAEKFLSLKKKTEAMRR